MSQQLRDRTLRFDNLVTTRRFIHIILYVLSVLAIVCLIWIKLLPQFHVPCVWGDAVGEGLNDIISNLSYSILGGIFIYVLTVELPRIDKLKQHSYVRYNMYREMAFTVRTCSNIIIGDCFANMTSIESLASKNDKGPKEENTNDYIVPPTKAKYLFSLQENLIDQTSRALEFYDFLSDEENKLLISIQKSFVLDEILLDKTSCPQDIWISEKSCNNWISELKLLEQNTDSLFQIGQSSIKSVEKSRWQRR